MGKNTQSTLSHGQVGRWAKTVPQTLHSFCYRLIRFQLKKFDDLTCRDGRFGIFEREEAANVGGFAGK